MKLAFEFAFHYISLMPKLRIKVDRKTKTVSPRKAKNIPVTQRMLFEVRDELGSRITSVRSEVKSLEKKLDARFSDMKGEFHRLALLIEEQNARNKFVLDGYASLHDRQDRLEQEFAGFKKTNPSV